MYDKQLHCTGLSNEIVELKQILDKARNTNTNVIDMTREELFKMKNCQDREYGSHDDRQFETFQREINHYAELNQELQQHNR